MSWRGVTYTGTDNETVGFLLSHHHNHIAVQSHAYKTTEHVLKKYRDVHVSKAVVTTGKACHAICCCLFLAL